MPLNNTSKHTTARLGRLLIIAGVFLTTSLTSKATDAAMQEMGVHSHLLRYDDYVEACDEMIAAGVKWVRLSPEWGSLQPSAGTLPETADPDRLAKLDYVVNTFHDHGVNVLLVLAFSTEWCSSAPAGTTSGVRFYPPSDPIGLSYWENYVEFLADRYEGKVTHWEVWNEPDHHSFLRVSGSQTRVDEYYKLLSRAAVKLHAADPANKVLMGGLVQPVTPTPGFQEDFLDELLAAGGGAYIDIINYHSYGTIATQLTKYQLVVDALAAHGQLDKKIWITETGYSTSGTASLEPMKADRVMRHWLAQMGLNNVERTFWYVDRNVENYTPFEANFGLRDFDRTPLKAWYAYQALDGATVDFRLQTEFPALAESQRTVVYLDPASGDGSGITDYTTDGSIKQIPTQHYMYFSVNDDWIYDANGGLDNTVFVDVTYLNNAPTGQSAGIILEYDSQNAGTAAPMPIVLRNSSGTWSTATYELSDIAFQNSQNNGADFRIGAGTTKELVVASVVVRRKSDGARMKFGPTDEFFLMERENGTTESLATYNPAVTFNGETCRQILNTGKYIVMRVSDSIVRRGDTRLLIKLRFWDDAGGNIVIQYNALNGSTAKNAVIAKTGTNAWRDASVEITDADFRNGGSWNADLRLYTGADNSVEHVSSIEIIPLELLNEDFQDGVAEGWTPAEGAWAVEEKFGNSVYRQTSKKAGETIAVAGQPIWNDYAASGDFKLRHAGTAGLLARYADADNYYGVMIDSVSNNLRLSKRVGGIETALVDVPWSIHPNHTYRLELRVNGTSVAGAVDGVMAAMVNDVSLSTGRIGVRGVDTDFSIDNINVR